MVSSRAIVSRWRAEMDAIEAQISSLAGLSAHELRATWRRLHCGEPAAASSRDLLMREIAYKLQERAHGGLVPAIKRRLRSLAEDMKAAGQHAASAPIVVLKPGTRVMREWGSR